MTKDIVKNRVLKYYDLEKKSGAILLGFAVLCMLFSYITENLLPKSLWTGMMLPLRVMALIHFVVGLDTVVTNSKKEKNWKNISEENRFNFLKTERKRIKRIDTKFKTSSNVLMMLILMAAILIILGFAANWGDFAIGTGLGLLIPSSVSYLLDQYRAFNVGTHLNFLNTRPK